MTREFLSRHAHALKLAAEETRLRAIEQPNDLMLQIAAKNQMDAFYEAEKAVQLLEFEQSGQLVDLRLIGPRATGSISLDWFLKAMEPLSKAWKFSAYRLRNGVEAHKKIGSEISNAMNLKLAGIATGSTRILVTGNAMPDLSGENLFRATFTQTFRLLNSKNDDFYDAVDAIGGKAAHQISEFMKALDSGGFAAEFTWKTPSEIFKWDGRPDEIARIRYLLDAIKEPEEYEETISGRVAGIADTGKLELRTESGKISIRFPLKLTDNVRLLTITSEASIKVRTTRYWDPLQKRDVFERQLISVI